MACNNKVELYEKVIAVENWKNQGLKPKSRS